MKGLKLLVSLVLTAFATAGSLLVVHSVALAKPVENVLSAAELPAQRSPTGEEIKMNCRYPVLSSYAGSYFSYSIDLEYVGGKEPRVFDLKAEVPQGFTYSIYPGYESTEIAAIRIDPNKGYPETIKVTVRPYVWLTPEPGEYTVKVFASSGEVKNSIELKAIVTAKYDMAVEPSTGRFNTEATAGQDNYFKIIVKNTGTAPLEKITFGSSITGSPSGWSITFTPDKIDTLGVGDKREVQVNIKPARKTIAGDYMVTISADTEAKNAFASASIRVTVLVPTIWGWVGVGIIVLVIAGLAVLFMRLGRR
jgi:uncharacterized membrane protein